MGAVRIFLHIPKTGGQSVSYALRRQYPAHRYRALRDVSLRPELAKSVKAEFASPSCRIKVVYGHVPFGHETFDPVGLPIYFSMLRDPVRRVVSLYRYLLASRHPVGREAEGMSFGEFVMSSVAADVDNGQTRILAGAGVGFGFGKPHRPVDEQVYETALGNLDELAVVGLTERFDDSLAMFGHVLKWRFPAVYLYRNKTSDKSRHDWDPPTAEEIALVRERNRFDVLLYEHAILLFQRQLQDMSRPAAWRRAASKLVNPAYGQAVRLLRATRAI